MVQPFNIWGVKILKKKIFHAKQTFFDIKKTVKMRSWSSGDE
jgi:hypothetical protein